MIIPHPTKDKWCQARQEGINVIYEAKMVEAMKEHQLNNMDSYENLCSF